jgi:hypothetical protein
MNEPRSHLPRDLEVLRYVDALNAGDLDAVAALWDEASCDPELERMLTELDVALFLEQAGAHGKADAKHPVRVSERFVQRERRWVVLAGALAAACLVAVLAWTWRYLENLVPRPSTTELAHQVTPRPPGDSPRSPAWWEARRVLEEAEMPPFTWPLEEDSPIRVSTSMPSELLD